MQAEPIVHTQPRTKTCSNKHCPEGRYNDSKFGISEFCDICTDRYNKDFYCVYCHQIYFETTDDGKNWIECDECGGWVHEECADVFISRNNPGTSNFSFKCIKCKKIDGKDVGVVSRRSNAVRAQPKAVKKVESATFAAIGFTMSLKADEIAEDVKKLQEYLRENGK